MYYLTGIESFLMYATETEIHGIQFDINQTDEALPLISQISMATAVDFHAGNYLSFHFRQNDCFVIKIISLL